MTGKQAVIETARAPSCSICWPKRRPTTSRTSSPGPVRGRYDGTTFHRVIARASCRAAIRCRRIRRRARSTAPAGSASCASSRTPEKHDARRGVGGARAGRPDSAGTQFFICITDQPALDGQYTVFARVAEGINVAQKISDRAGRRQGAAGRARRDQAGDDSRQAGAGARAVRRRRRVDELGQYARCSRRRSATSRSSSCPTGRPNHVRNFLRLAQAGVYDGSAFHRVVKGFVIQGGYMPTRKEPLDETAAKLRAQPAAEFNDTPHEKGIVSMARLATTRTARRPRSSSSCAHAGARRQVHGLRTCRSGMDVVEKIEAAPVNGETPVTRIEL